MTVALRQYKDKLGLATATIRTELDEWKKVITPREARMLHQKVQEGWLKELESLTYLHNYNSDVVNYGYSDDSLLCQCNSSFTDAWRIWQEALHELDDLVGQVGR